MPTMSSNKNASAFNPSVIADKEIDNDYYHALGFPSDLTPSEKASITLADIKKNYRALSLKHHADKNKNAGNGDDSVMKRINEANAVLGDAEKRKAYDEPRTTEEIEADYLLKIAARYPSSTQVELNARIAEKRKELSSYRMKRIRGVSGFFSKVLAAIAMIIYVPLYLITYPVTSILMNLSFLYRVQRKKDALYNFLSKDIYNKLKGKTNAEMAEGINDEYKLPKETKHQFADDKNPKNTSLRNKQLQTILRGLAEKKFNEQVINSLFKQFSEVSTVASNNGVSTPTIRKTFNVERREALRKFFNKPNSIYNFTDDLSPVNDAIRDQELLAYITQEWNEVLSKQKVINKGTFVGLMIGDAFNLLTAYLWPIWYLASTGLGAVIGLYNQNIVSTYKDWAYDIDCTFDRWSHKWMPKSYHRKIDLVNKNEATLEQSSEARTLSELRSSPAAQATAKSTPDIKVVVDNVDETTQTNTTTATSRKVFGLFASADKSGTDVKTAVNDVPVSKARGMRLTTNVDSVD